jgi:hypothetical protein
MEGIGAGAMEFCRLYEGAFKDNARYHRSLAGIISLRKRYPDAVIDQACRRACYYGNITYRAVKNICEIGIERLPLPGAAEAAGSQPSEAASLERYRDLSGLGVME